MADLAKIRENDKLVHYLHSGGWEDHATDAEIDRADLLAAYDDLRAERDALKAAIEKGQVARFAADVVRLVADYSNEERGIIALTPFEASLDQLCLEKYGFDLDKVTLDTPSTPESPREDHVDRHGRSWGPHPFVQSRRVCRPACVCGRSPDHEIHQPAPESPESEETTDGS